MIRRPSVMLVAMLCGAATGCTRESTRTALESQRRADDVQRSVVEQQHAALRVLLYRDMCTALASAQGLDDPTKAALDRVWNDRDQLEFWLLQFERAAAMRIATVDAKLFADQSIVDLLWKQLAARGDRAVAAFAASRGAALVAPPVEATPERP